MIFFPSESFIIMVFFLAFIFLYMANRWKEYSLFEVIANPYIREKAKRVYKTYRYLSIIFVLSAIALGVSGSLIDLAGYPLE